MQGKLVKLRGYEKSDVDALIRWFSDEEVTDFVGPTEWPVTRARFDAMRNADSSAKAGGRKRATSADDTSMS
jgi:RimJ/RimL family protein N-acetyltransferase